jgi:phosphopentomutase
MNHFQRVFFIVLDACGVGELPDAADYGDVGSATIPHVAAAVGGLHLPNMEKLGLGKIIPIAGVNAAGHSIGAYGKMAEKSPGKDSTTGHWEHFGVYLDHPFPVYPHGFPPDVMDTFTRLTGYGYIGNCPASGTEIIARLGEDHLRTGKLIVYTSADSVFQIAAHDKVIGVDELYRVCRTSRNFLVGRHGVGRVIARPFTGEPGAFVRTSKRKDFSLPPPYPFVNQKLVEAGINVLAIGKIYDIMAELGVTKSIKAAGNISCLDALEETIRSLKSGLVMVNLVDFDMLWGHRNDFTSFARGLEEFDLRLGHLLTQLRSDDLLIITADHGCDPTTPSTDHSREYVPLLAYYPQMPPDINLGIRSSFADTGKTIADIYGITDPFPGRSFLTEISHGS